MTKMIDDLNDSQDRDYQLYRQVLIIEAWSLIAELEKARPDDIHVELDPPVERWNDPGVRPLVTYEIIKDKKPVKMRTVPFDELRREVFGNGSEESPPKYHRNLNLGEICRRYFMEESDISSKIRRMHNLPNDKGETAQRVRLLGAHTKDTTRERVEDKMILLDYSIKGITRRSSVPLDELCLWDYYSGEE